MTSFKPGTQRNVGHSREASLNMLSTRNNNRDAFQPNPLFYLACPQRPILCAYDCNVELPRVGLDYEFASSDKAR